jgi:hypothetical protein
MDKRLGSARPKEPSFGPSGPISFDGSPSILPADRWDALNMDYKTQNQGAKNAANACIKLPIAIKMNPTIAILELSCLSLNSSLER